jgi:hypothetical protein
VNSAKIILIGGTSHTGKSTLATRLVAKSGYELVSTDSLARHPGRPWQGAPPSAIDYFLDHTVEGLVTGVIRHYEGLAPQIVALMSTHLTDQSAPGLIVEGSAIWPGEALMAASLSRPMSRGG